MEVTMHEFVRNTSKWMKEALVGDVYVTVRGLAKYVVKSNTPKEKGKVEKVLSEKPPAPKNEVLDNTVTARFIDVETAKVIKGEGYQTYGCGCKKEDGILCTRHGRM